MEYVVETPEGVEYCFSADEVEDFEVRDGAVAIFGYDLDSNQAFAAGAWTRFYIRSAQP